MSTVQKLQKVIDAMNSRHVRAVEVSFEYEAQNIRYYSAITAKDGVQHKYTVRVQDWQENGETQRFAACNCRAGSKGMICRHIVRVAEIDTERTGRALYLDDLAEYKAWKQYEKPAAAPASSCGCVFNWDDKFVEWYCDEHYRQMLAYEEQAAWEGYDAAFYA